MTQTLSNIQARRLWIRAQKLDTPAPFGNGAKATQAAVEHLGYVQIDTINVIERCHHHILYNRIPEYRREDLQQAQSKDKSVFEYWTHALSYVPTQDFRFFMGDMKQMKQSPSSWFKSVKKEEVQKVLKLIKKTGPVSIRDIGDDELIEKDHPWASRKPSKKAMQYSFFSGDLVVSERIGMLKKYELVNRHFEWKKKPKAATEKEVIEYLLDRALRSQSLVSLESICHLEPKLKPAVRALIEKRVKRNELLAVQFPGAEKVPHWIQPQDLETTAEASKLAHILSPFDPLTIQRKRFKAFFDYDHRFEAYLPKEKRIFGYFTLPVLMDDQIVAALDLKTDREKKKLLVQKWNWIGKKSTGFKNRIEEELHRFEKFQLGK